MTDNRYYEYFGFFDWIWWSPEMLADALSGWTPVEPQLSLVDHVAANYRHPFGSGVQLPTQLDLRLDWTLAAHRVVVMPYTTHDGLVRTGGSSGKTEIGPYWLTRWRRTI